MHSCLMLGLLIHLEGDNMQISSYEDLFYVYEKYLKSDECKTLDDAKKKFKELALINAS